MPESEKPPAIIRNTGAPELTMGSCAEKPILSGKYHKLEMPLIFNLTHRAPRLSLAGLWRARNTHTSLQLGFVSGVVTFLLSSPEAGDTDGCFVDVPGCKRMVSKTGRQHGRLGVTREGGSYGMSPAQEKIKIRTTVSTECVSLLHHHKVKNSEVQLSYVGTLYRVLLTWLWLR